MSPSISRRTVLTAGAIAASTLLLASCSTLIGPRDVTISQAKMQQGLERRFPIDKRLLSVIDVKLFNPQVTLQPERERVALAIDATATPPFVRQQWRGNLQLSGHLVFNAQRNAVYLSEASVDKVAIAGMDEAQQRQFAKIASLLADQLMHETPIYTFKPDELRYAGVQFVPVSINTTSAGLVVRFEPAK